MSLPCTQEHWGKPFFLWPLRNFQLVSSHGIISHLIKYGCHGVFCALLRIHLGLIASPTRYHMCLGKGYFGVPRGNMSLTHTPMASLALKKGFNPIRAKVGINIHKCHRGPWISHRVGRRWWSYPKWSLTWLRQIMPQKSSLNYL